MKPASYWQQVREVEQRATRGPWFVYGVSEEGCAWWDVLGDDVRITGDHLRKDDAEFIALSREALPAALEQIDEQARRIAAVGELLAENGCDCDCGHHHEEHNDDCERCLACRINDAVFK